MGTGPIQMSVGSQQRSIQLMGSGDLKTATFFMQDAEFSAKGMDYDLVFEGVESDAVISFVRVIKR